MKNFFASLIISFCFLFIFSGNLLSGPVKNPFISSFYPGPTDYKVPDSLSISISFTKSLDQSTVSDSSLMVYSSFYGRVKGTVSYDGSRQAVIFNPERRFHPNEIISVSLVPGIRTAQSDTVSAFSWSFTVSPLSGTGSFAVSAPVSLSEAAGISVPADLDNDGLIDVVYTTNSGFGLIIMKNLGDLKFSSKTVSFTKQITELAAGDLDGDGRVDILVKTDSTVTVLKQMPDGEFKSAAELNYPASLSGGLAAADMDADGKLDISICAYFGATSSFKMLLYRNMGNMQFQLVKEIPFNYPVNMIRYSDLDGNGYPDMVIASTYGMAVLVLKNSGDFNFSTPELYRQGLYNDDIECADFDNDGFVDIACSGWSASDYLSILKNDGTGKFTAVSVKSSLSNPNRFTLGDFNNDGKTDIGVSTNDGYLHILMNKGDLSFTESETYLGVSPSSSAGAADFDNDGDIDIAFRTGNPMSLVIAKNRNVSPEIKVLSTSYDFGILKAGQVKTTKFVIKNEGASEPLLIKDIIASNKDFSASASKLSIAAGDTASITVRLVQTGAVSYQDSITITCNDKKNPVVKFYVSGRGAQVLSCYPPAYSFSGSDTAALSINFSVLLDPSTISDSSVIITGYNSGLHRLKSAVFDPEKRILTLKTVNSFAPSENVTVSLTSKIKTQKGEPPFLPRIWNYNILSKPASMKFTWHSDVPLPFYSYKPQLRDMDNDGLLDIIILTVTNSEVIIYKNEGNFRFTKSKTVHITSWPEDFIAADLDNDGDIDIAVSTGDSKVQLIKNEGNYNFSTSEVIYPGYFTNISAGDYNNDGLTDIAISTESTCYLKNLGNFKFEAAVIPKSSGKVLASWDFDDDGDLDLAMRGNNTQPLRNEGNFIFTMFSNPMFGLMPTSCGDYNGDGLPDFSGTYFMGSDGYGIAINKGELNFEESMKPVLNNSLKDMVSRDFDGDSTAEFIALSDMNLQTDKYDKSFKRISQSVMPLKNQSYKIIAGDLNNDGTTDLLITTGNTISVFENREHFKEIAVNPSSLYFDTVPKDSLKPASFTISNPGTLPLRVDSIYSSSAAFKLSASSLIVAPADSQKVTVTFTPKESKAYSDSVIITSDDTLHPVVKVYLKGSCEQVLADSLYPKRNAPSADPSLIAVKFRQDIVPESVTPAAVSVYGMVSGRHSAAVSYDAEKRLLSIIPTGKFSAGERTDVTISKDLKLKSGEEVISSLSWSFFVKVNEGSAAFNAMPEVKTGSVPRFICSADFDKDGVADIVTSNQNSDDITIIRGSRDSKLTAAATVSGILIPAAVVPGDFDGDGLTDIAVAGSFAITFLRNKGDFSFSTISMSTERGNRYIDAADLDGDMDLDVVTVNPDLQRVTVLRNDGDFHFTFITLPFSIVQAAEVKTGDMDNDGDIDILISSAVSPQLTILKNMGNMNFQAVYPAAPSSYATGISLADFDNDGRLDFAAGAGSSSTLVTYLNQGGMKFVSEVQSPSKFPYSLSSGDFDADGDIDLAALDDGFAETMSIYKNNNTVFKYSPFYHFESGAARLITGDFNDDGAVDIAFVNEAKNTMTWLRGLHKDETGISEQKNQIPDRYELLQNYPNPFNPSTSIHFGLPAAGRVRIRIINALGQVIAELADQHYEAGWHEVKWKPAAVSSGIYFYYMEAEPAEGKRFTDIKKMVYLK